jgi:hypothetical protein
MIEVKQKPVEEKTHNRKGGAFHTLAHVMRDLRELVFTTGFIMRNRPGRPVSDDEYLQTGKLPFQSMVEMLFPNRANNGNLNGITIGRQGDGEFRNTNIVQIEADHDTGIGDSRGYVNGVIRGRVSRDGSDDMDRGGLYVMDRGTESASREGTVTWLVASGEGGQVRLSYMPNKGGNPLNDAIFDIYISSAGITIFGLPTTNPGGSGRIWKNGTTLSIT